MSRTTIALVLLALVLAALPGGPVTAQDAPTKQVGLVIAFPGGATHMEVVTAPTTASTLELLQAADIRLTTLSSALGQAICGIDDTGCPADDCFCDSAHFWAYYHLDGETWYVAVEGVSSHAPADRAVEGFAWSGFGADFLPTEQPPLVTFEQIAAEADLAPEAGATSDAPGGRLPLLRYAAYFALAAGLVGAALWASRRRARGG